MRIAHLHQVKGRIRVNQLELFRFLKLDELRCTHRFTFVEPSPQTPPPHQAGEGPFEHSEKAGRGFAAR
jgi:hypothetical protein